MTVIFSKKCELALQGVLFLSAQEEGRTFNSQDVANYLKAPKEFVSKVLQILTINGIVGSRKGNQGGFYLAKKPSEVRLIDIVIAIDGMDIFHHCVLGFRGCSPDSPCPVHDKWGKLRNETYRMLSEETLEELRDLTISKLNSL